MQAAGIAAAAARAPDFARFLDSPSRYRRNRNPSHCPRNLSRLYSSRNSHSISSSAAGLYKLKWNFQKEGLFARATYGSGSNTTSG